MISYYQLKKCKKNRDVPKLGRNWAKVCQNWQKLVKNQYYVHFERKKCIKKYQIRIIQNKEAMISHYQLNKIGNKHRDTPKLGQNWSILAKIGISCLLMQKNTKKMRII